MKLPKEVFPSNPNFWDMAESFRLRQDDKDISFLGVTYSTGYNHFHSQTFWLIPFRSWNEIMSTSWLSAKGVPVWELILIYKLPTYERIDPYTPEQLKENLDLELHFLDTPNPDKLYTI